MFMQMIGGIMGMGPNVEGMTYEDLLEMFGDGMENKSASQETIDLIEQRTITSLSDLKEGHRECRICPEDYCVGDCIKVLPCGHDFHCKCNDQWMKTNACCPICKFSIKDWAETLKNNNANKKKKTG